MSNQTLRSEHDAVLASLSTRVSTRHFAHAAVAVFGAVVLFGTAGKLWWDQASANPQWATLAAGLGLLSVGYAVFRAIVGARTFGRERVQLVRLLGLRKTLGIDAPAVIS
jgi:hypothetical protein